MCDFLVSMPRLFCFFPPVSVPLWVVHALSVLFFYHFIHRYFCILISSFIVETIIFIEGTIKMFSRNSKLITVE